MRAIISWQGDQDSDPPVGGIEITGVSQFETREAYDEKVIMVVVSYHSMGG